MLHSILISHNLYVLFYDILFLQMKMIYEYMLLFWFSIVQRLRMALLIRALYKICIIIIIIWNSMKDLFIEQGELWIYFTSW